MIRKEINHLHLVAALVVVLTPPMLKAAFLRKAATMITKRKNPLINAAVAEMLVPMIIANPSIIKGIAQTLEIRERTGRNLTVEIGREDDEHSLIKFKVKLNWNLNGVLAVFLNCRVCVARSRDTL